MCGCPYSIACGCHDDCIWYMEIKYTDSYNNLKNEHRTAYPEEIIGYGFRNGSKQERVEDAKRRANIDYEGE